MKPDPVHQKLRETAWRRRLTPAEQAELQAWLAAHPEAQVDAELDAALDAALEQRPPVAVSSNFTARVMQAIATEAQRDTRPAVAQSHWWRKLMPRLAIAAVVLVVGVLAYRQHLGGKQKELATTARHIAEAQPLSSATIIADYEVIRSLTPPDIAADEKLLALSDELLALHQ